MVVNSYFSHIAALHSLRALSRFKYKTFSQKITTIRPVFYWQSLHKFRHFHIIWSIFAINRQENSGIQIFFVYLFRKIGLFTTLNITENEIT